MIAAAGIEDQELPIAAKSSGVNNPTVAGRGDFTAGASGNGNAFLGSTGTVGAAELANPHAIDRQMQASTHVAKGHRGRQTARIAQGGEFWMCRIFGDAAIGVTRRALGTVEAVFQLGDQVLDAVDLARQIGGALPLAVERLLGVALCFLPLIDQ